MEEKKQLYYKWIFYIAALLLTVILESTLLSKIRILGGRPQLLLYAVSVIAMLEGVNGAAGAGLAAGLFMDAMTAPAEGFYTVIYVICGIVVSIINAFTYHKTYSVSLLFWVAAVLVADVLYYVFFMLVMGKGSPVVILFALLGEIIATLICTPVIYLLFRTIYRRFAFDED